jgi:glycosyltransferase involved in cell wall biosynthesis
MFGYYYEMAYGRDVRSRILIKGLRRNGINVIDVRSRASNVPPSLLDRARMLKDGLKALREADVILVGWPAWRAVYPAKLLSKLLSKPLIVDAFISLYDTEVFDRKRVREVSIEALRLYLKDKVLCELADHVLLDTEEHIKYFSETFHVPRKKFSAIYVGSDDDYFYPKEEVENNVFLVTFHGSFIPLHGIEHIIRAMKLLGAHDDIRCEILGSGQTYGYVSELAKALRLKNVIFHRKFLKYEELPSFIAKADVCLGIFGVTPKAKRVVPTKVYDVLAMKKPLITGDTPAIREAGIVDRRHALLVEPGNPKALAGAILELKEDKRLRRRIAEGGYALFKEKFTPKAIGERLKEVIEEVASRGQRS